MRSWLKVFLALFPAGEPGLETNLRNILELGTRVSGDGLQLVGGFLQSGLRGLDLSLGLLGGSFGLLLILDRSLW